MQKVYYNGEFITLENKHTEAILIENDKIKRVGSKDEVFSNVDNNVEIIDLQRKNYDASLY